MDKVIDLAKNQAQSNPYNVINWIKLGDDLRSVGRKKEALDAYKSALFVDPQNEFLAQNVALFALDLKDTTSGVNLLESIEIAKQVSNNDVVTQALENVKKGVFSGDTLTKLFLKEPVFPPTFSQLISVGEQTGNLDEMFTSVSSYYEEEFDTAVDNMSSLIEPIMIVFMGTMIGGLMIAMYSPIFNVGAIIGG